MIGMVTLNYTPSRWLGAALPIDWVREVAERLRADAGEAAIAVAPPPEGPGSLGLELVERDGKLWIGKVAADGPAAEAGLAEGFRLLEIGGAAPATAAEARARLAAVQAGALVTLKVEADGERAEVKLRARPAGAKP
jgi:S1-C subfamily serine protease